MVVVLSASHAADSLVDFECGIQPMDTFIQSTLSLFQDVPHGDAWGYLDDNGAIQNGAMYPTLEIDYLAVRKDMREMGYGTAIIAELCKHEILHSITASGYIVWVGNLLKREGDIFKCPFFQIFSYSKEICRVFIADSEEELSLLKEYVLKKYGAFVSCAVYLDYHFYAIKHLNFRAMTADKLIAGVA